MYTAKDFIARLGWTLHVSLVREGDTRDDAVTLIERTHNDLGGIRIWTRDGSWYEMSLVACGRTSDPAALINRGWLDYAGVSSPDAIPGPDKECACPAGSGTLTGSQPHQMGFGECTEPVSTAVRVDDAWQYGARIRLTPAVKAYGAGIPKVRRCFSPHNPKGSE